MSLFNKFIANVGWTTLGKFLTQILLFVISIFLTRYLGKERLGDYATLLVIPVFIRLLNTFGFETLINKYLPELNVKDSSGAQGKYLVSRLLALRFLTTFGFCILMYIFLPYYFDIINYQSLIGFRWVLIFYFIVITIDSLLSTLFMTLLRFKILVKTEVAGAIMNLLLLILFIHLDYGIYGVLYAYIISTSVTNIIYLFLARKQWLFPATTKPEIDDIGQSAWVSYGIGLMSFGLMTQSDVLLMNYFNVDRGDIGLYHLSTGFGGALAFLLAGIAPMAFSLFSETYTKNGIKSLENLYCQIVGFASYLTIPINIFCALNASHVINFIYGPVFIEGKNALAAYVTFAGIQTALGINFTVSCLFVIKKQKMALRSTVEGGILNIVLNLVMIPSFGIMGAITATGLVMLYVVVRQLKVIASEMEITRIFPFIGQCSLYCFVASIPPSILSELNIGNLIPNLILYLIALIGLLIYIKPFNDKHKQLLINVYPRFANWSRYFFAKKEERAVNSTDRGAES